MCVWVGVAALSSVHNQPGGPDLTGGGDAVAETSGEKDRTQTLVLGQAKESRKIDDLSFFWGGGDDEGSKMGHSVSHFGTKEVKTRSINVR